MFKNIINKYFGDSSVNPAHESGVDVDINHHKYLRLGSSVLLFGFGGFLIWAAFAPLDAGVPSQGTVIVASNTKTIQHQTGGIVEKILVDEGSQVKRGQALIKLNETDARSQLKIAESQFIIAKTVECRLQSEKVGAKQVVYDNTLKKYSNDSKLQEAIQLQNNLFRTRQANIKSEINILEEEVAGLTQQLNGYLEQAQVRKSQSVWMKKELDGIRDLAKDGYVPKNKMFQLERSAGDISSALSDLISNIGKTRNAIAETKLKILTKRQEYQKEVESQLSDVRKDSQSLYDKINALEYNLSNMVVKSPINGVVMNLSIHTEGGVVQPGGHIMDIVPKGMPLIVEAQVSPENISKVKVGLPVDLNFTSLDRKKTPTIPGTVMTVSADRLTEQRTGTPYYLVRVKVTDDGMKLLGHQEIVPGMPTTVVVKTGERTLLNYLVKPLVDRVHTGFKED